MRGNEMVNKQPLRCYDNGGKTVDRYTVVYMNQCETASGWTSTRGPLYESVGMSGAPFHPQGVAQHSLAAIGEHLGERIPFASLPDNCRKLVLGDLLAISTGVSPVHE